MTEPHEQPDPRPLPAAARDHRRQWRDCLYLYPVISRRARGLSVGVNLNPDKRCTFSCLYCQINRRMRREGYDIRLHILREELESALAAATSGELWSEPRYAGTPEELRRINDIAFSGDGEPTCLPTFDRAVATAAEVKNSFDLDAVKLVVITNAAHLHEEPFRRALPTLDAHNGEVWAKLDAGTEAHFRAVNRPRGQITLERIVRNIREVARVRPVVIQSLFLRLDGEGPSGEELDAWITRLREVLDAGGHLTLVQVHTIARAPASPRVRALPDAELDAAAERLREAIPELPVEVYYGEDVPPQDALRRRSGRPERAEGESKDG